MLHHLSDYCPVNSFLGKALKSVLRGGWCGVDLFFVLSGFLITGILLDTRGSANYFRAFYARRVVRIFPLYYATLIFLLCAARFAPSLAAVIAPAHDQIWYFFYLNNWWILMQGKWHGNYIGHFWSLAVEEQFYLIWPFVVWWLAPKRLNLVALSGIFLAFAIRLAVYCAWGALRDIIENPFCRMDSLLMGALLASLARSQPPEEQWQKSLRWVSLATGLTLVAANFSALTVCKLLTSPLFIFSGLAIVFGGLVSLTFADRCAETRVQRILQFPFLARCGKYSYAMYVFHVPLLWLTARNFIGLQPTKTLLGFLAFCGVLIGLTFTLAKLSFDHFEIHFLRLKSKVTAG